MGGAVTEAALALKGFGCLQTCRAESFLGRFHPRLARSAWILNSLIIMLLWRSQHQEPKPDSSDVASFAWRGWCWRTVKH